MFQQIKITKEVKKCPQCGEIMEWVGGKSDDTKQEYLCRPCRIYVDIYGMTKENQESIAEEAFF